MKNKRKILLTILWIIISIIVFTIIINLHMILSTKNKIIELKDLDSDYDAILVLGCKVEDDIPSLMLKRRLDKTIDVYNKVDTKVIISGNTRDDYDEVGVMNNYLKTEIPSEYLVLDSKGISTYDSLFQVKNYHKLNKIVIVTQKYHMYRALYLANKLDIDAVGIVADDIPQKLIMLKNEIREIFARDKNFIKGIIKPNIGYVKYIQKDVIK